MLVKVPKRFIKVGEDGFCLIIIIKKMYIKLSDVFFIF